MRVNKILKILLVVMMLLLNIYGIVYAEPSIWAKDSIEGLKENNMLMEELQDNEKFKENITREEFTDLAVRLYAKGKNITLDEIIEISPFMDTDNPMVGKAYTLGIVSGVSDTEFAPENPITRQEIATILTEELKKLDVDTTIHKEATFDDMDLVAIWAKQGINFCAQEEIISGIGNNLVAPLENTTREQAIVLVERIGERYNWIGDSSDGRQDPIEDEYTILSTGYKVPIETNLHVSSNVDTDLHLRLVAEDRNKEGNLRKKIEGLFEILKMNQVPDNIIEEYKQKIEDSWSQVYNAPQINGFIIKDLEDGKRIELSCSKDVKISIYTSLISIYKDPVNLEEFTLLPTGYYVPKETNLFIDSDGDGRLKLEIGAYQFIDNEDRNEQINQVFTILQANKISQKIIDTVEKEVSSKWDHERNRPGRVEITYIELENGDNLVYSADGYVQIKIFTY